MLSKLAPKPNARAWHVPQYRAHLSDEDCAELLKHTVPTSVPNLVQSSSAMSAGVSTTTHRFACQLYEHVWADLGVVLEQRRKDQLYIDTRIRAHMALAESARQTGPCYRSVLGKSDESDRVVLGPNSTPYFSGTGRAAVEPFTESYRNISPFLYELPGIEVPSTVYFNRGNPVPEHLVCLVTRLIEYTSGTDPLVISICGLTNEEEAAYWKLVVSSAERILQEFQPLYKLGSLRVIVRFDNPRSIFRINEIMDALFPHFIGGYTTADSYVASIGRCFREAKDHIMPTNQGADPESKTMSLAYALLKRITIDRGALCLGDAYGVLDLGDISFMNAFSCKTLLGAPDIFTKAVSDGGASPKHVGLYDAEENIRTNWFLGLQSLASLLSLQSPIVGQSMDQMERSRWNIWHAIYHDHIEVTDALRIGFEELKFIKKNLDLHEDTKTPVKSINVRWCDQTDKWYPIAMFVMVKLVTDKIPVENVSELALIFSSKIVYEDISPLTLVQATNTYKFYCQSHFVERFIYFFERCGCQRFATQCGNMLAADLDAVKKYIYQFTMPEIIEAASFHGNIGEKKISLDKMAAGEQALVLEGDELLRKQLIEAGKTYKIKYGMKFLVSAKGKTGTELLSILNSRMNNNMETELMNAREALWQITQKRVCDEPCDNILSTLQLLKERHQVKSVSVCLSTPVQTAQSFCVGDSEDRTKKATTSTLYEIASLSKTIGTAFAIEYFTQRKIPLTAKVNDLLKDCKSEVRLRHPTNTKWGDEVNLLHCMSHCALNMHYVNGVPLHDEMPDIKEFLLGNERYGYPPVAVLGEPGIEFHYSGAGFLVLQHLIELFEGGKNINEIMTPFLEALGISSNELTFEAKPDDRVDVARGYDDTGTMIEGGRKMFPGFAAGAVGTPAALMKVMNHLSQAFTNITGSGPISHDTAVVMLNGTDKGCKKFMGCQMGVGVFVMEARNNRFSLHQGANDGFRSVFLHCFSGPDKGAGLVVCANGDNRAMILISELMQCILKQMRLSGVDLSKFMDGSQFKFDEMKQEEIVNFGYKSMVFDAFEDDLPDIIAPPLFASRSFDSSAPLEPLHEYNGLLGASLLSVTEQGFAQATNLVLPFTPMFDATLFGPHGKVMDSWESVRHNPKEYESVVFELKQVMEISYVSLSTKWHYGNSVKYAQVFGRTTGSSEWIALISKTRLQGHAEIRCRSAVMKDVSQIMIHGFPDGGLARVGVYGPNLPDEFACTFDSKIVPFSDPIPTTVKPMSIEFDITQDQIQANFDKLQPGEEYDAANLVYGGSIVSVTNEHYGASSQTISPYMPISMFDGFESARSHDREHVEEVVLKLRNAIQVERVEIDLTYFVHNAPVDVQILGALSENEWLPLTEKTPTKAFAGNTKVYRIACEEKISLIKLVIYPDGGFNRVKVIGRHTVAS